MAIVLENLTKHFGSELVVNDLCLRIESGELFVLLGSSGSGKSTILRLIAGLLVPDAGSVELHGRDVTHLPVQKRDIGFVFQSYAIFNHMSVATNIEFALRVRGVSQHERIHRRSELLELVGLGGYGQRMPNELSGGQRQRVALARALAHKPQVLLLDEPFSALDLRIRLQLRETLKEIQQQLNVTTIFVTHDQEEAYELADRIAVLEGGHLLEIGSGPDLYHRPKKQFVATFLGGGNVIVGRAEKEHIRLGGVVIPWPAGAPPHQEGSPVRILFRPESVRHQPTKFDSDSGVVSIGQGRVISQTFMGAVENIRLELQNLAGTRPLRPTLAYGQRYAVIEASQASISPEGENQSLIGQTHWLGLTRYHILEPAALRFLVPVSDSLAAKEAVATAETLCRASHGTATLLQILPSKEAAPTANRLFRALLEDIKEKKAFQSSTRSGTLSQQIVTEIQASAPDIVILPKPKAGSSLKQNNFIQLIGRILKLSGAPILIPGKNPTRLEAMLICTAAGEPGKADVTVGARLARHLKSKTTVFHVIDRRSEQTDKQRAVHHLEQALEMLRAHGVAGEIKHVEQQGSIISHIMRETKKDKYDLVVIGAPNKRQPAGEELIVELTEHLSSAVLIVPSWQDRIG